MTVPPAPASELTLAMARAQLAEDALAQRELVAIAARHKYARLESTVDELVTELSSARVNASEALGESARLRTALDDALEQNAQLRRELDLKLSSRLLRLARRIASRSTHAMGATRLGPRSGTPEGRY